MEHSANFDLSLHEGQLSEANIQELLTWKAGEKVKFEVKTDFRAAETGDLFFEYKSRGKDSGLKTTEADWWVVCFGDCGRELALFLRVGKLKPLLRKMVRLGAAKKIRGGDENSSEGVLVSLEALFNGYFQGGVDEKDNQGL